MKRLKSTFTGLLLTFALSTTVALCSGSTQQSKQDLLSQCPKGLVCFTPEEAHRINVKLIKQERDVKVMAIQRIKRFGTTIGCGVTYGFVEDAIDASCGVMWGIRF